MPVEYQLVTLTGADGHEHDALFVIDERAARRRTRMTGRRTACMHVHGIMGNFLVGTCGSCRRHWRVRDSPC